MPDDRGSSSERPIVWLDGRLVPLAEAVVSPTDPGFTVGTGIFETLKVVPDHDGRPQAFALTRHLRRLRRSAAVLGLDVGIGDDDLRTAARAVLDANEGTTGQLRITVAGGVAAGGAVTVVIARGPSRAVSPAADVVVCPWRRNEHSAVAGAKTTSYAENVVARRFSLDRGCDEALLANTAGDLCEGTMTNVFVAIDGRLLTPPLTSGCLAGVTRELLLEEIEVHELDLPIERLADADEVFLTSSLRDVQPVRSIDGVATRACPGPLTQQAVDAFRALEGRTLDP